MNQRQSRSVAFVYGGISGVLLVVVAVVALVLVPPSPPSVAEFSPSADETIDDAPDHQSSRFGTGGDGACADGQIGCVGPDGSPVLGSGPSTTVAREVLRARVRRCVGDPPRQTEDPQSPPCVNYFEGDNGGSTWRGVTRDEIRVAYACTSMCAQFADPALYAGIVEHFNRRYELYGRKIRMETVAVSGSSSAPGGAGNDADAQRRAAQKAAEEAQAFAVISPSGVASTRALLTEVARRGMVGIDGGGGDVLTADLERAAPLLWSYQPTLDALEAEAGAFACASLAGKRAAHAGTTESLSTRRFAIAVPKRNAGNPPVDALHRALARCGVTAAVGEFGTSFVSGQPAPETTTLVADWRAEGITTVFSLASPTEELGLMSAASRSGFQPEWVHIGLDQQEGVSGYQSLTPQDQSAHVFGLASRSKLIPIADRPFFQAMRETRPEFSASVTDVQIVEPIYRKLLVLVAGIQLAGPDLTPSNIERGLFRASFANPGAAAAPFWQSTVDPGPGRRWYTVDLALKWWEPSAEAYNDGSAPRGSWCYVDAGARFRGQHPDRDAAFFDRTRSCR